MEAALEWQRFDRLKCPGCGQPRDECMDPNGPSYHAEPLRCFACQTRDSAREQFSNAEKADMNGLFFTVSPED